MSAMSAATKTLVIRNGTLIDGSGKPSNRNDAVVIEGNRIKSVGAFDKHLRRLGPHRFAAYPTARGRRAGDPDCRAWI